VSTPTPSAPIVLNERGTVTVKETATHLVEVLPMIYNFRLVLTPKANPDSYDAGWCYFGTGSDSFTRCYLAALAFDPDTEADPAGYDKALQHRRVDG
jgi:hypothetical protein